MRARCAFVVPFWFIKPTSDGNSANCDLKYMSHKVYADTEDEFVVKVPIVVNKKVIEEGQPLLYYEKQTAAENSYEPPKKKLKNFLLQTSLLVLILENFG